MYRQSSSRNQRSKGIKIKHVLQTCLLLAVCFWLLYQVKHSHDKKKEFSERNGRTGLQRADDDEFIKLGRKDIHSRADETVSKNEKDDELAEEEEEAAGEKSEENKNVEDEPDYNAERKEDEAGGGDNEADEHEHEQEKSDGEDDREDEVVDVEEREVSSDNGTRETDSEHAQGQVDKEVSAEDTDHDGDDDLSINEAREEHYKADDASSAVTHNTPVTGSVNENLHGKSLNEIPENISEEENKGNNSEGTDEDKNRKSLELEDGESAGDNHHLLNVTAMKTKFDFSDNSENGTIRNSMVTEGLSVHLASNHSNEITAKSQDLPLQNATESKPELDHRWRNLTEGTSAEGSDFHELSLNVTNHSAVNANDSHFDSDSAVPDEHRDADSHSEEFPQSFDNASKKIIPSQPSVETGNSTESSSDEMKIDQSGTSDATYEAPEDIEHDVIDISDTTDSLEEKDVRVDHDTLPDIQTEGSNRDDIAVE